MRAAGFWSLLDVIRVYAQSYVHLGRVFQYWMDRSESEKVSREDRQNLTQALRDVVGCCKSLGLTTSEELIRQANTDFFSAEKLELDYFSVSQKIGEFERCVTAELKSRFFFFIPSERARYLVLVDEYIPDDEVHVGAEVQRFAQIIDKFKGVTSDIVDAGNCFATGAYTACVYHLMRTCEYGLVSLAEDLGVDPGFGSWEKLLSRISNKIGQLDKKHPEGWKERRDFYSEAATLMQNVKNSCVRAG